MIEEDPLRPRAPYWDYRTTHALADDRETNLDGLALRRECVGFLPE
jgi:acetolactate synthase I/II/III large subunit